MNKNEQRAHDFAMSLVNSYLNRVEIDGYSRVFGEIKYATEFDEEKLQKNNLYTDYKVTYENALNRFNQLFPEDSK
ncbi:hypothetical protein GQS62_03910 [Pediococcus pentosaceus]|uniref:hypothetical protein n=1 Tax=Pediococcus pentosaceus TaxID=1255 RepID=UPI001303021F|nr:hypothetical protein [Pediococcus pentosaceus]QGZ70000.1 hypothetical protein GQS62_03910 [Pediococcus pentosaceus]QYY85652.1 hypothetical protein GRI00_03535 [Pediococcus pentosaceus]